MSFRRLLRQPSAFLPIALSAAALALLLGFVAMFGVVRNQDEGTAAHFFQLLMATQSLIVVYFGIKWLPRAFKPALLVLTLQFVAALVPMATLWMLEM